MIYRIAEPADWVSAQATGAFASADLAREGFIHCASRIQVAGVVDRYYAGRTGLVLLAIEETRLGEARLVWENTSGGAELFPHVYGLIPLAAVTAAAPLTPAAQGGQGAIVWPPGW